MSKRMIRNSVQMFQIDVEVVGYDGSGVGPGGMSWPVISEPVGARELSARPKRREVTS